jgi:hypothetical protein
MDRTGEHHVKQSKSGVQKVKGRMFSLIFVSYKINVHINRYMILYNLCICMCVCLSFIYLSICLSIYLSGT